MSDTSTPESGPGKIGLFKKAKPIYWIIAVVLVGGAYLYYRYKKNQTPTTPTVGTGGVANTSGDTSSTAGYTTTATAGTTTTSSTATNAQWVQTAINGISATNQWPALDVANTIGAYAAGTLPNPTTEQAAIISYAVQNYGPPPEGVPSTGTTTANSPTPIASGAVSYVRYSDGEIAGLLADGTVVPFITIEQYIAAGSPKYTQLSYPSPPRTTNPTMNAVATPAVTTSSTVATGHNYTVVAGDTLAGIASRFYGTSDYSKISAANPGVSTTPTPGTILIIPT